MDRNQVFAVVAVTLLIEACLLGLALIVWPDEWCVSNQSAAAWVQSIGSVVAIVVAILIASQQHRSAEARITAAREDEETRLLLATWSLVKVATGHVRDVYRRRSNPEATEGTAFRSVIQRELTRHCNALASFPVNEFPPNCVMSLLNAIACIEKGLVLLEPIERDGPDVHGALAYGEPWRHLLQEIESCEAGLFDGLETVGYRPASGWNRNWREGISVEEYERRLPPWKRSQRAAE